MVERPNDVVEYEGVATVTKWPSDRDRALLATFMATSVRLDGVALRSPADPEGARLSGRGNVAKRSQLVVHRPASRLMIALVR